MGTYMRGLILGVVVQYMVSASFCCFFQVVKGNEACELLRWCMILHICPKGGLVFICGTLDGLIQIAARRHNTEDLIATVMAVEPHSFVYKGRYRRACTHMHITCTHMYITVDRPKNWGGRLHRQAICMYNAYIREPKNGGWALTRRWALTRENTVHVIQW